MVTGCSSAVLPPDILWAKPAIWLHSLAKHHATLAVTTAAALHLSVDMLAGAGGAAALPAKVSLAQLERCLVLCPGRPRHALMQAFTAAFAANGLSLGALVCVLSCPAGRRIHPSCPLTCLGCILGPPFCSLLCCRPVTISRANAAVAQTLARDAPSPAVYLDLPALQQDQIKVGALLLPAV